MQPGRVPVAVLLCKFGHEAARLPNNLTPVPLRRQRGATNRWQQQDPPRVARADEVIKMRESLRTGMKKSRNAAAGAGLGAIECGVLNRGGGR